MRKVVHPLSYGIRSGDDPFFLVDKGRFLGDLGEGEKENTVAKVIERIRAHYEVQDLDMGKVYQWSSERLVVECECGKKPTLTASKDAYCTECWADHRATIEEALGASSEEDEEEMVIYPWCSQRPCYTPSKGT